jgi:hypothetical protein
MSLLVHPVGSAVPPSKSSSKTTVWAKEKEIQNKTNKKVIFFIIKIDFKLIDN